MSTEFCVLDTEGTPTLREVAVVDERGQRIFEARTPRDDDSDYNQDGVRPLPDLLRELGDVLRDRRIVVAHKASHDRSVIEAHPLFSGSAPGSWLRSSTPASTPTPSGNYATSSVSAANPSSGMLPTRPPTTPDSPTTYSAISSATSSASA
ncbi:MAG: hypothetical protein ERJ68_08525 [Aphanocapsa feldmannii 277cI]|uniref:Exonuclease domain-containing protein n=1 Tax=Aphanocapsa feldmannii 277cI TaxID=2507554 RepID=A0A524RRT8_9CHRO|nr:MAG: hypothetical protein ERJ68_08525 [Aphanocapsa feldmannii 277cI]